jgi:chromosome segregation ATPase
VAAEAKIVETQFSRAREVIPALRERQVAETGKTADLEAQKEKLTARKTELKNRLEELTKSTDSLRRAKGDLTGKQEENLDEIRDLQGQLANLEKKKALLEQALGMVMEKKTF